LFEAMQNSRSLRLLPSLRQRIVTVALVGLACGAAGTAGAAPPCAPCALIIADNAMYDTQTTPSHR